MALKFFKANINKSLITWKGKKITGSHTGTIGLYAENWKLKMENIVSGSFDIDTRSITITDIGDPKTKEQFFPVTSSVNDFFAVDKYPSSNYTIINATFTWRKYIQNRWFTYH
jgi:hypothetical protein